jgi:hypothetical protein
MNRNQKSNLEIDHDTIDQILATEEPLIPSSGFLASVMKSVHEEARTPARIPFPWKRAIPGILLAVGVFGWGAVELVRQSIPAVKALALSQFHLSVTVERPLEQIGWVALALALSLASWLLSRRLAGQSGLI